MHVISEAIQRSYIFFDEKYRTRLTLEISKFIHFTVSHFSYAPLIKCKIIQKRKSIFLIRDYQRRAHI